MEITRYTVVKRCTSMSFKVEWKVLSQIQMKKGLACLIYSQKYITLYKSTLEKRKNNKKNLLMRFIIFYY